MIVNMLTNATPDEINHIIDRIKECGFQAHVVKGEERTIIGAIGSSGRRSEIEALRAAPGVADVIQISHPFKLVSRQLRQARTVVDVRWNKDRQRRPRRDRWSMLSRVRRATDTDCARRKSIRRAHASRWRLQTPDVAVRFSGTRRRSPLLSSTSEQRNRIADRD